MRTWLRFPTLAILFCGCMGDDSQTKTPPVPLAPADSGAPGSLVSADQFLVKLETSKGDVLIEVHPEWAPRGAARFRELVEAGFFDDCRFFRVLPDFMVQVGINGDPAVQAKWRTKSIPDDPVKESNLHGYVTYATSGPNSRTSQFFINTRRAGNKFLDTQGFAPFGKVVEGMDVVDSIEDKYREDPQQGAIQERGNEYLNAQFPDLDYIKKATIVQQEKT